MYVINCYPTATTKTKRTNTMPMYTINELSCEHRLNYIKLFYIFRSCEIMLLHVTFKTFHEFVDQATLQPARVECCFIFYNIKMSELVCYKQLQY